jgi:hypothetical protein
MAKCMMWNQNQSNPIKEKHEQSSKAKKNKKQKNKNKKPARNPAAAQHRARRPHQTQTACPSRRPAHPCCGKHHRNSVGGWGPPPGATWRARNRKKKKKKKKKTRPSPISTKHAHGLARRLLRRVDPEHRRPRTVRVRRTRVGRRLGLGHYAHAPSQVRVRIRQGGAPRGGARLARGAGLGEKKKKNKKKKNKNERPSQKISHSFFIRIVINQTRL